MAEAPVVTLDGPSGTGKGTVGRIVAATLGWHYLDSGAVYRVFGYMASEEGILPEDKCKLAEFSKRLDMFFAPDPGDPRIVCNGMDLTEVIRTEACGALASRYAASAPVRELLLKVQRAQRRAPGLVADGRDMGTSVFPDAPAKIFLEASPDVRVDRRYKQLKEKGFDVNLSALRREMAERDARDANREASPLFRAPDAVLIDTSDMDIETVVRAVLSIVEERIPQVMRVASDGSRIVDSPSR